MYVSCHSEFGDSCIGSDMVDDCAFPLAHRVGCVLV